MATESSSSTLMATESSSSTLMATASSSASAAAADAAGAIAEAVAVAAVGATTVPKPTSVRSPTCPSKVHCFENRRRGCGALAQKNATGAVATQMSAEKRRQKPRLGYSGLDFQVKPSSGKGAP